MISTDSATTALKPPGRTSWKIVPITCTNRTIKSRIPNRNKRRNGWIQEEFRIRHPQVKSSEFANATAGSALGFTHSSEKRPGVVHPQLRLLKRGEVPAMRHRREVHDVISGFGGLASFGALRVDRGPATIVLQRKRTAAGRSAYPAFRPRERRRSQTAKHVPAFAIDPCRRSAAVCHPIDHDVRQQFILGENFFEISIMIAPPVPFFGT